MGKKSAQPRDFICPQLQAVGRTRQNHDLDAAQFMKLVKTKLKLLDIKEDLLQRAVNVGFSGGEKKRNEIFQMAVLEPKLAILDETDSGLDIDALRAVSNGVNTLREPGRAILLITHYQRLLDYIEPDFVHVLADGKIYLTSESTETAVIEAGPKFRLVAKNTLDGSYTLSTPAFVDGQIILRTGTYLYCLEWR